MRITLEDIAARSGVSKTTVSYVLNNKQTSMGISPDTIAKVRGVMEELNYAPDKAAVALGRRRKRKATVLILTPWLSSANSHFMTEVSRAAEKNRRAANIDYKMFTPGELRGAMNEKALSRVDRFLIVGTNESDERFLRTFADKDKLALINRTIEGVACFASPTLIGGGLIAEHVLRSSYYGVYLILSNKKPSQALRERADGIVRYFEGKGLKRPQTVRLRDWSDAELREMVDMHRGERPFYFTLQDGHAVMLASMLRAMAVDVPREAGVSGYDNDPAAALVRPGITTIDSKTYEVAERAFAFMLSGKVDKTAIEPELVVRESTI